MKKIIVCLLLFLPVFCFAQTNSLFQIQVGAFRDPENAERVFSLLLDEELNPSIESLAGYTRVRFDGVNAQQVSIITKTLHRLGFSNPWIREESPPVYKIQVGTFSVTANANRAFNRLRSAGLSPSIENHMGNTRVLINDIELRHLSSTVRRVNEAGFTEVWIRE